MTACDGLIGNDSPALSSEVRQQPSEMAPVLSRPGDPCSPLAAAIQCGRLEGFWRARPAHTMKSDLGKTLRRLRQATKTSVRTLATRVGFSASFISQVERGQASPSI